MECFTVLLDEIEGRIDPNPYHPIRRNTIKKLKNSEFQLLPLKDVVEFKKQIVTSKEDDLIYIGLENIESNTGVYTPSEEEKEDFGTAFKFEKGDILFPKLRPYLNKVHLAEFNGVCSTEFYVLNAKKCDNVYLFSFLNSPIVVNQTSYLMTGNTLPRLQTEEVENLIIPIPPIQIQDKIIEITKKIKDLRKQKESKSLKLLDSIKNYVLEELKLNFSEIKEDKIYCLDSSELKNNRNDPYYFNPKFKRLLADLQKSKIALTELKNVADNIFSGKTPAKEDYAEKGNLILKVNCLKNNKVLWNKLSYFKDGVPAVKTIKEKDILLLSSAHQGEYLGKNPSIVELPQNLKDKKIFFVGELISIRPNTSKINPYYLLAILKLHEYYLFINREKRGQTSHLYSEDLRCVKIPLPTFAVQNKIAEEVKNRMLNAELLQKESKDELKKAKQEVERIILGD